MCDQHNTTTRVQAGPGISYEQHQSNYKRLEVEKAKQDYSDMAVGKAISRDSAVPDDYRLRAEMDQLSERLQKLGVLRQLLNRPVADLLGREVVQLQSMCRELGFNV